MRCGDEAYSYDAFGNQTEEAEDSNPFRYAGEYWDSESGLIYLRARYYDSGVGAFVSEDPAKDGLNWYSYCAGNPVNFVDPTGYAVTELDLQQFGNVPWAINELAWLTSVWINGNEADKAWAAAEAQKVRRRGRVVSYAYAMYNSINENYPVRGSQCANFVSAALHEGGGFAMTDEWHHWGEANYVIATDIQATDAWATGSGLFSYFDSPTYRSGDYTAYITNASDVQKHLKTVKPGDIIGFDDDNDGTITHVGIITKVDSSGIYYTAKDTNRIDQSVAGMYEGVFRNADGSYTQVGEDQKFKGKMYIIPMKYD